MDNAQTEEIEIAGARLTLHPSKAIWWAERSTLLIADAHFGKAATFRAAGRFVPTGTTALMIAGLSQLMTEYQPQRMIVLGDLIHSSTRSVHDFESELIAWRESCADMELLLVRGNHDRGHQELFRQLRLSIVNEPYDLAPFALCHRPETEFDAERYGLAGHIHPGIALRDGRLDRMTLPCFHFGARVGVLPAFGIFTGLAKIQPEPSDRIYAIAANTLKRCQVPSW